MAKQSIAFFFPYKEVSGCPVLFLNIANKIEDTCGSNYDLYLVDYEDGYMAKHLNPHKKIALIPFSDGEPTTIDTDYLVMQAYLPAAMRPELKIASKTKALLWMLHPMNFLPVVFPFNFLHGYIESNLAKYSNILQKFYPRQSKLAKSFLLYMVENNGTVFMNRSDLPVIQTLYNCPDISPQFIPIASSDANIKKVFVNTDIINMGWVGRLCDFKISILNYTMRRAFDYANCAKRKILFHVIGSGEEADKLFNQESDYFHIKKVGTIAKEDLDKYLVDNVDINFAMGTSVIESAKLGVPSVKLDFSNGEVPDYYEFEWFSEADGFDIGHVIGEREKEAGKSVAELVSEFDDRKQELSNEAIEHYEKYFSLGMVTRLLLEHLPTINVTWGEIPDKYKRLGFTRKVYYKMKYKI